MKQYNGLSFAPVYPRDIDALTAIMKRAFDEDTRIHTDRACGGPPGYDNGEFLRKYALDPRSDAYKVLRDGEIIGCVIVWIHPDTQNNYLGCLFVDAALENRGIGKSIWEFIEKEYPDTALWRVETPIFSHRNHHFYINKCGFCAVKIENPRDMREGMFVLEKRMGRA